MSAQGKFELLLIDDDQLIAESIELCLPSDWNLEHSTSLQPPHFKSFYTAAFVDMHLSDSNKPEGVEVIAQLRQAHPHLEIVAISGDLDRELMESCLKAGASRFLAKPLSPDEVLSVLEKIEALWMLRDRSHSRNIVQWRGEGPKSQEIQRQIANLAGEAGPILIEGESGTGKEVVAGLLHAQGRKGPLVSVNVAAIPEDLFESEFFGSTKGAFTGADRLRIGLAEAAEGGDLFLDEVEALPLGVQAKLLRFLESGEIRRVGSQQSFHISTRVIAATNRKLTELVKEGKFREDLLWRLSGQRISTPPLRERKEDIADLAGFFLHSQRPKRNKSFSEEALAALQDYNWPGNVRELKRVCEQLGAVSPLPLIRREDVTPLLPGANLNPVGEMEPVDFSKGLSQLLQDQERAILISCLKKFSDIEDAAKALQISRSSLYKKLKDHQIETKRN